MSRARTTFSRRDFASPWPWLLLLPAFVASLAVGCGTGAAPSGESTDLFLVDVWSEGGLVQLGRPERITDRAGYDNQPCFSADGRSVLFVSREGKRADILRYGRESGKIERVTSGGDREYSPQPLPSGDGFSAIRAEREARQRLWTYDSNGDDAEPLFPMLDLPFLYYAWADDSNVVAVLEGSPGSKSLYLGDVDGGEVRRLEDHVGRSVQRVPGRRAVSFVHKETAADWWVKMFDLETGEISRVARTLQGVEDHAWTPAGVLVMARGSELWLFAPGSGEGWKFAADFADAGLRDISRIAVSPEGDAIVLVAARGGR
jgi:hypothetical protein